MSTQIISPIKEIRLRHGISQKGMAQLADMSPQAVMRYEQGVYDNLSNKLADALALLDSRPVDEVHSLYAQGREEVQVSANFTNVPPLKIIRGVHPFWTFREDVMLQRGLEPSRIAFCILLAIHPATVAEYDNGRVAHMPALIERALNNAGMDHEVLDTLKTFGELWYERHVSI